MTTPLPQITSLARSGALDRAWALFREGGYETAIGDPAALAVKGRLLKDMALRALGAERARLLGAAEAAYASADALSPQPWLLINVATLAALQGDGSRAAGLASQVLARLHESDVAETPYFIQATRAEAHLLRGDLQAAQAALTEALAADRDGWADHATTLRQFALILDARGDTKDWLNAFRPPRSLHFAGHLGFAVDGASASDLQARVKALIAQEKIGFGYGALAAGADIIIAEALLDAGAELHLVLSTSIDEFRAQSVAPLGGNWRARYDAILARATSLACATAIRGDHEPLATALASKVAMGAAAMNARALESEAIQLLVLDEGGGGTNTARQGDFWKRSGRRQTLWKIPRDVAPMEFRLSPDRLHPTRRLAAMLVAEVVGDDVLAEAQLPRLIEGVMAPLGALMRQSQPMMIAANRTGWCVAYEDIDTATDAALALQGAFAEIDLAALGLPATLALRITGHFALVHAATDAATGTPSLFGEESKLAPRIAPLAAPGAITVTEPFAAALFASGHARHHTEFVGDPFVPGADREVRLFAVK
jgi:hypothetical protein